MKTPFAMILAGSLCLLSAHAQFGPRGGGMGGPGGSGLGGSTAQLFGQNTSFSATMEMQIGGEQPTSMPGKLSFDQGKSRFEMDMTQIKSDKMPPGAAAQMKTMGMDKIVNISRPDKKVAYIVYPGMQAYVENPLPDTSAGAPASDFKVDLTELGRETVDGHECVKNKAVVTDKDGTKHESTVWNATDLKKFPVKIEQTQQGTAVTMLFKDVKLDKPDAGLFDPPSGFTKYDSMQSMMQQQMMKRLGGQGGVPPRPPQGQ